MLTSVQAHTCQHERTAQGWAQALKQAGTQVEINTHSPMETSKGKK